MTDQQPHTSHIEEVGSAYVQYHHFNSYGMDDSEETEKSFYRMIARIESAAEQRGNLDGWDEALELLENNSEIDQDAVDHYKSLNPNRINRADRMEGDDAQSST